jgi:glycolate oxidase FAD binding subunit
MDLAPDTPANRRHLCAALRRASDAGGPVRVIGGGTGGRRGLVTREPSELFSTREFDRIITHEPADLVTTVEAGVPVRELQRVLRAQAQTWIQAPDIDGATVGGLLSRAASSHRRLRYGAIRDSLLQVVMVTGDGRLVHAGGKTVKGVAGYDIPRLVVGAHGTLGVIVEVTLKLWPLPSSAAWFSADGPTHQLAALGEQLRRHVHQPASILLSRDRLDVELIGPPEDLVAPAGMHISHAPPVFAAAETAEVGVSPALLPQFATDLAARAFVFQAHLGVGLCTVSVNGIDQLTELRDMAIARGGRAVILDAPDPVRADPWGPPPAGLAIMRRLKEAFDPAGILNRGQFIGDLAGAL